MTSVPQDDEKLSHKIFRLTVGIVMATEAFLLTWVAIIFGFGVLFLGGLAFVAGAGGASEENIRRGWHNIFIMMFAPLIWPILLWFASVYIVRRKRPVAIIVLCTLTIILQLGIQYLVTKASPEDFEGLDPWHPQWMMVSGSMLLISIGGVVVAIIMKRKTPPLQNNLS